MEEGQQLSQGEITATAGESLAQKLMEYGKRKHDAVKQKKKVAGLFESEQQNILATLRKPNSIKNLVPL